MRRRSLFAGVLMLALLVFGSANLVRADITGKIFGTVVDPTGAVVPGAIEGGASRRSRRIRIR